MAYDGPAKIGGCWLCCKTSASALALLDGSVYAELSWHAIVRGAPDASDLRRLSAIDCPEVIRSGRSVRYASMSQVSFTTRLSGRDAYAGAWREQLAAGGYPVVGDRPHCDGPAACACVCAVRVLAAPVAQGDAEVGRELRRLVGM